jgi:hypothetical protein
MKNIVMMIVLACWGGFSFGADCSNGFCNRSNTPVLSTTRHVVRNVVRTPSKLISKCVNGKCRTR